MDQARIADCINRLGDFCALRDLPALTAQALRARAGWERADLMILFGACIPAGMDLVAQAYRDGIARRLMLVGGEGHTTAALREAVHAACPQIDTAGRRESEVMAAYLQARWGLTDLPLERNSTNCGNNVTLALEQMARMTPPPRRVLIVQDGTMQRRMDAGFRKYAPQLELINYAAWRVRVIAGPEGLAYDGPTPWGMWDIERYLTLLMGEIPRLRDDAAGYGPRGKDFIAHVDIPEGVLAAFQALREPFGDRVRGADPRYAAAFQRPESAAPSPEKGGTPR